MTSAIVYDMDGMLFHEPHFYTKELEAKYGIALEDSLFHKDDNYKKCKMGIIKFDEFFLPYYNKWKLKYPRYTLSYQAAILNWFDFAILDKDVFGFASKFKNLGGQNFILTDNVEERINYLCKKYKLESVFEISGSYKLGMLKESVDYYIKFIAQHSLNQNDIIIFDDKKERIDMLNENGFKAKQYTSIEDLTELINSSER